MKGLIEMHREWFVVPNVNARNFEIIDIAGELIATVEDKNDAIDIVKIHNLQYGHEKQHI